MKKITTITHRSLSLHLCIILIMATWHSIIIEPNLLDNIVVTILLAACIRWAVWAWSKND